MERWEENERAEREQVVRKARERVVSDFEKGMGMGLGVGGSGRRAVLDDGIAGVKFDGDAVERISKEAEDKAIRIIEKEQNEARKSKLAAFWLPSLTPDAKVGPLKDVKLQTLCQVGGQPHPIS
jgi:nitric oxide synthase-interacting protein